jgi:phosphoribosylformylglycinamidine synthase
MKGELVADVPADDLVLGGGAPVYHRDYREPAYYKEYLKFDLNKVEDLQNTAQITEAARYILSHPNIASKKWVYEQYDSMVGIANRSTNAPSDAAIVRIKGTEKSIVITVDCNSRYVQADPEQGTAIAVAEAARNIVCSGGEPVAITNCLNFGNPYVPEVYWQFVGAIKGMKKACEKFSTPVTGGNVSFYNQSSDEGPVFPTPTIGMLGLMENPENRMTLDFKKQGDIIYLIGQSRNDLACSQYLYSYKGIKASPAPYFDMEEEFAVQALVKELIYHKLIESAHDVADGGLFTALAESAMPRGLGFNINPDKNVRMDAFLFGESQSRVVVSVKPENNDAFFEALEKSSVKFSLLGKVHAADFRIVDEPILTSAGAKELYDSALGKIMEE